jgi:alkanesulfonate monooxygenase SsuD/methylene tetrahydromethanopterin reductase-like flavin-dependent oxidoreductase (luciferase family)
VATSITPTVTGGPDSFLDAARAIWDSWDDNAVTVSQQSESWARSNAVSRVRTSGPQVDIDVVPTLPRSRQGQPVIFQTGDSSDGRDFAARHADVIFSAHGTQFDDALDFANDIRSRLLAAGRGAEDLRILPGTTIVIDATEKEATEKARWVRHEQVTPGTALVIAGRVWNIDLSDRDPDGPLPAEDPHEPDNSGAFGAQRITAAQETVARWRAAAEATGWSLRETVIELSQSTRGHVGTPAALAEKFIHFVRHGALDGFNISPYFVPHGLDDIVDLLVPELQERGAYRTEYRTTTLRQHLNLPESSRATPTAPEVAGQGAR